MEKRGYSASYIEKEAGLGNGLLGKSPKRNTDLSTDVIDKVSKRFGSELKQDGFRVVDLEPMGRQGLALRVEQPEKLSGKKEEKPEEMDLRAQWNETKEELRYARQRIDQHVDFLQDLVKSSLNKLIEGQAGGLAVLLEVLDRDIRKEAAGNKEKEKEIRAEIAHRIGPKLNADLKADISADAGR